MNRVQEIMSEVMMDYSPMMDSWKQHNCPACVSRGQPRPDSRGRGNHMFTMDGSVAYNCFNCHLKAVWSPGARISRDMTTLLNSFGMTNTQQMQINACVEEMINSGEYEVDENHQSKIFQRIMKRELPPDAKSFTEWVNSPNIPEQFIKVLHAVNNRNPYMIDLELYWSPSKKNYMHERFILPYYMNGEIVGFTARHINKDSEFRYYNQVSTQLFYNYDLMYDDRLSTLLVAEGPLDAALMGGMAANNYYLTQEQIKQLLIAKERGKRIVIVPDRDKNGKDSIKQAIDNGFCVSLPDFGVVRDGYGIRKIKDFEEACSVFGRLYALQLVHNSIYESPLDIGVHANLWI